MKEYFINLDEGLAEEKFKHHRSYGRLGGYGFKFDNFIGNKNALVCDPGVFSRKLKKDKYRENFLGKGSYGTVNSIVFDQKGIIKFSFKRAKYESDDNPKDQQAPPNVEVRMMKYLSEFFTYPEVCPHFVQYIGHNRCLNRSPYMVLMMEQCSLNLEKLIENKENKKWKFSFNSEDWNSILFQIIFSLAVLQDHNKDFRHNDLKPDNIFINILPSEQTFYYYFDSIYYSIKTKYFVKIADFGMSCIDGVINNRSIMNGDYKYTGITQKQNRNVDLFFFMSSMEEYYYKNKNYKQRINTELFEELLDTIVHYKNKVKRTNSKFKDQDNNHLLENESDNKDAFPKNLVSFFEDFEIRKKDIPNDVVIYSTVKNHKKINKNQKFIIIKPVVKLKKNIILRKKPVIIVEKEFTQDDNEDDVNYTKKEGKFYTVFKRSKIPSLSQQDKNHLLKLAKSGVAKIKCPKNKIPNYNVKGRCTLLESKEGQRIQRTFKLYEELKSPNMKKLKKIIK